MFAELLLFLESPVIAPQIIDSPPEVLVPPSDLLLAMWSEPSQIEHLRKHCQTSIQNHSQAVLLVLRLLVVRAKFPQHRSTTTQALSWTLDCLVRVWAVIDSWTLIISLRTSFLDVVVPYFQGLRALFSDICTIGQQTVLVLKAASLFSRSIAGLLQVCLRESNRAVEHALCSSLLDLLRLCRASRTIYNVIDEHTLPLLQELVGQQVQFHCLSHDLQVHMPDCNFQTSS